MRCRAALIAAAALAASSCGSQPEGRDMSANEVAGTLEAVRIEPGLWQVDSAIVDVRAPNLPVEVRRRMIGPRAALRNCVTSAQAARPDAGFLAGRRSRDCAYRDFTMADGRLRGTMACHDVSTVMDGYYGREAFALRMEMASPMPDGATMRIHVVTRGHRIGPCDTGKGGNE